MKKSLFLSTDILCFSCQRWNMVYQRSQHLLSRFGQKSRVFYIEEPVFDAEALPYYSTEMAEGTRVQKILFHLPAEARTSASTSQQLLLNELMNTERIRNYVCWYNLPSALAYSMQLDPLVTVYDCLQDNAVGSTAPFDAILMEKADVVFTSGYHLFESKRHLHRNMYCFPNSIDKSHFHTARFSMEEPIDQFEIPHPRIGFYGVIDERLDIDLLNAMATAKPDWHFILVGPLASIDPSSLSQCPNVHLLPSKEYSELPQYLSGWDVAMMPFSVNGSTQFHNPASTLEFLAAGKPVVATPVYDIVHPYGKKKLVHIAHSVKEFIASIDKTLTATGRTRWIARVNRILNTISWDKTFRHMEILVEAVMERNGRSRRPFSLKKATLNNNP